MIKEIRIGFCCGEHFFPSGMIAALDFSFYQGKKVKSVLSHVLLRFIWEDGPDLIAEALLKQGIDISPTSHLGAAIEDGRVVRYSEKVLDIPAPVEREKIWRRAASYHGAGYDTKLIALYLAWIRFGGKSAWAQKVLGLQNSSRFVCSEYVTLLLGGKVPQIPVDADLAFTPETIFFAFYGIPSANFFATPHLLPEFPEDPIS
jgi:hypothetical protein